MRKILLSFSFFAVILGCASTSDHDTRIDGRVTPPLPHFQQRYRGADIEELKKIETGPKEVNIQWWKTYHLAAAQRASTPQASCQNFKQLSEAKDFILNDLALLRAYEVCPTDEPLLPFPENIAPWYRELAADIRLSNAQQKKDTPAEIKALVDKALLDNNKKRKEALYLQALNLAKQTQQTEEIETIQERLYKNSPRLNPKPHFKDLNSVAWDHRYHREFDKALATYRRMLKNKKISATEEFQIQKSIRQTYKVAQRKSEYIKATADLVNKSKKHFLKNKKDRKVVARYHDAQILLALTLWTEDQNTRAVKTLNETKKRLSGLYPMDEVYFILGRIQEEKGHFEKALEYFEASYKEPISQSGLRDKISWLKSWNYYKLGKWEEAKNSFTEMRDQVKEPSDKARARFWLSRCYSKLGQTEQASAELKSLANEDALGYYGVLAVRELKQSFPALKNEETKALDLNLLSIKEIPAPTRLTAEWLIAVGEKSYAEKLLNIAVEDLKKQKVSDDDIWLSISSAYARSGLYLPLFSAIGGLQPDIKDRLVQHHPHLLFPQAYQDNIREAAERADIPPEFIFSIIRQESAFNPEARSPADAFGLMQLLPSIARKLAKKHNLEFHEAHDLMKPEVNIPLGAFELKTLMNKYNQQFILAVSGYNANDAAIRGWMKTRYRPDSVEFIEEVPYEETRTYIKLVMRNYVFYQRLLNPKEPTEFPESLLNLSQI